MIFRNHSRTSLFCTREDFYSKSHPTAVDILLLIEVAEASLMYDRHTKIPLYLRSGIQEVWLVDLVNHAIDVHSQAGVRRFVAGATIVSSVLPDLRISVADVGA